jgi:regulator of replication initiation timing
VSDNNQVMNEVGLLNLRINDFMNQLNKTVKVLLDENQKLTAEVQQLKGEGNVKTAKKQP